MFTLWKGLQKLAANIPKIDDKKLKTVDPIDSFIFNEANEAIQNYGLVQRHLQHLESVLFGNEILTTEI